jgi:putative DNA primase/helicase
VSGTAYDGLGLSPEHEAKLASSAISSDVAGARGYRTLRTKQELADLGFGRSQQIVPTLLVPVWGVGGEIALRLHRPDEPRTRKDKVVKYENPATSRMVLDVPPQARKNIGNPGVPLWITEGVLKADAAVSAGLCCVAVLGVWNWRGTNSDGGKTALADWESVALNGRKVYVAFDSDVMTKPAVHAALARLGALLARRGAKVAYVYLPAGDSGDKVGLDDYLAGGGTADELPGVARSKPVEPAGSDRIWPPPQDPMAVARHYMRRHTLDGIPLLRHWRGAWMRWRTTHWAEVEEGDVQSELYVALEHAIWEGFDKDGEPDDVPWRPNRSRIANVLEALAAVTHLPNTVNPPAWLERDGTRPPHFGVSGIVACANGLLDVATRTRVPHTPAFFNVVSVPFDYEAGATAPLWETFLGQLWPDDTDSIAALQEWCGYLIGGRTNIHKITLVVGPTRGGKGTIARIVKRLLGGDENVAGPTLASLGGQFGLMPLIGKPLAIISDARISGRSTVVVERLLSISGEDTLTVDRKHKDMWTGQLPTRLMIMSNELPSFGDDSGAIVGRFIVLVLRHSWLGKEDKELTEKLAAELPGILNWSLDGLKRLEEVGRFTEPKASDDAIITLLDQASPTSAFARDCCDIDPAHQVTVDDIYGAWKLWCEYNGRSRPGNKQDLGKSLNTAVPGIHRVQPREAGSRYRAYQGIQLNDTWAELLEEERTRLREERSRLSGESPAHNGEDRVPPRAGEPDPGDDSPPDPAAARGGTRENPLQAQVSPDTHTPDSAAGDGDSWGPPDDAFALVQQDAGDGDWSA